MKGCWILSNAFSVSNEMIICFFFQFIYVMNYIDRFSYVEPSLHLWNDADLIFVVVVVVFETRFLCSFGASPGK